MIGRTRGAAVRWIRVAQYVFLVAGITALGYCVATWFAAERFQAAKARELARELRAKNRTGTTAATPPPAAPRDGGLIGRLEIPRLGLSVMVVEGVGDGDLKRAAGHVPGTALPGQPGNIGIAGHRDTFFRPLRAIRPNDRITLRTEAGVYQYRVTSTKVVTPDDVQVLDPTGRDTLTLVTCFPFYYVGHAPKRFIVQAQRS